jgi:hypothetical protein
MLTNLRQSIVSAKSASFVFVAASNRFLARPDRTDAAQMGLFVANRRSA